MALLSKEVYISLPEDVQKDYEQSGDGYTHRAEGKLAALKGNMNDLNDRFKGAETRLQEIERTKAEEIEAAKAEALEQARSNGDVDGIEKRYQEQMADLQQRAGETQQQQADRIKELETGISASQRKTYLSDLRAKLKVFEELNPVFDNYVGSRVEVDPITGKRTFLEQGGGATSLDDEGFISELMKDPAISRLRQGSPTGTGGVAEGNTNGGGAAKTVSRQQWDTMSAESQGTFVDGGGSIINQ